MIKVRILGSGLIPRGGGLAPKKEPIYVDFDYLTILMYTRSLRVQYLDPDTEKFHDMTLYNFKKTYDKLSAKFDMKIKEEREAKAKEEKAKALEMKKEEVQPIVSFTEQKSNFSKKDKYFKKNKFEQRQKSQEIHDEIKIEDKPEEKTE